MGKFWPDRKVLAGGVAGLLAFFITAGAAHYGIALTPDMQSLIVGGVGWLIAYLVPPSQQDIIKRLDEGLVAMAAVDPKIPVRAGLAAVIEGTKRITPLLLVCILALGMTACAKTVEGARTEVQNAIAAGQELTPEQKWTVACSAGDATHLLYQAFVAPKQSEAVNIREAAAYAAIVDLCMTRPSNYATALVALLSAVDAFKKEFAASKAALKA